MLPSEHARLYNGDQREERAAMTMRALCRVGWHKYGWRHSEGASYRVCRRCGKENHNETRVSPGAGGI